MVLRQLPPTTTSTATTSSGQQPQQQQQNEGQGTVSDDSKDGQEKTGLGKTCLLVCIQTPVVICLHTIEHRLAPTTGSAAAAGGRKRPLTPVEESVQRAKEAVMLDLADPQSWCEWVLGFQVWGDGTVASTTDRSLINYICEHPRHPGERVRGPVLLLLPCPLGPGARAGGLPKGCECTCYGVV